MNLFRFPVNSPNAVSVPPSRLIKDTRQVIDYIHEGQAKSLQRLFDHYMLPEEQHVLAMEQFAAIAGMSYPVDPAAVERMRSLLMRGIDAEDAVFDTPDSASWLRHCELLTECFMEASVHLQALSQRPKRKERALLALCELGRLNRYFNETSSSILSLGSAADKLPYAYHQCYSYDIQLFIDSRDAFLDSLLEYLIAGLPRVTKPYLTERDRMELGVLAIQMASHSQALFQLINERVKSYSDHQDLEPMGISDDWRGLLLWQNDQLTVEMMAERALRILRFQAKRRAMERAEHLPFIKRQRALRRLRRHKLT